MVVTKHSNFRSVSLCDLTLGDNKIVINIHLQLQSSNSKSKKKKRGILLVFLMWSFDPIPRIVVSNAFGHCLDNELLAFLLKCIGGSAGVGPW